ncbi:hypothetical protein FDP41_000265 [Naegleria fowleri]|uniref:Uncharacterized protein n=1 Tax=Naegleria fowleri TaxID=5763 RepID=A0A6A5CBX8_NAEFO|nr:uncharacterized protein FDP41_000265 [Naegleria fowleri]KAF0985226.1 hypothetical protein FDP41_000265 [Naegleria fowleri]
MQPQQSQTTSAAHACNSTSTAPSMQGSSLNSTDLNASANKFAIVDLTDEVKLKTQFKGDKLLKVNKQFRSNSEFQSNYFFFKTKKRKGAASCTASVPTPNSDDELDLNAQFYNERPISPMPESNLKRRNTVCMLQTSISTSVVGGSNHLDLNPTIKTSNIPNGDNENTKRPAPGHHLSRAQSFSFPQEYGHRNKTYHQHHQCMTILNNQVLTNVQLHHQHHNNNNMINDNNNCNFNHNDTTIYTPTKIIRLKKDVPQTPNSAIDENEMNIHSALIHSRNDQLCYSTGSNHTPNQFNNIPNSTSQQQVNQTNAFPNVDRTQINSPNGQSSNDFFSRLILSQQQQQQQTVADTKASFVTSPRTPRAITSPRGFNRVGRSLSGSYNYRRASVSSESLMTTFRSNSNPNNFDPMVLGSLIASLSAQNNVNNNGNPHNGNNHAMNVNHCMTNSTVNNNNNLMFQNSMSGFLNNSNLNQTNACIHNQGNLSYPTQVFSPQHIPSQLSFLFQQPQQQSSHQSMNVNTPPSCSTQPINIVHHTQNRPQQLFLSRSYSPGTDINNDSSFTPRSMHSTDSDLNSFSHLMIVDSESSTPRQTFPQAHYMESTSLNDEHTGLDNIRAFMDDNSFLPDEFRVFEFPSQPSVISSLPKKEKGASQLEQCPVESKSNEDVALQSTHDVASIPPVVVFNNTIPSQQQTSQPTQTNPSEQDEIDEIEQFLSLFA